MTTRTQVIWTIESAAATQAVISAELDILIGQGKTDGTSEYISGPEENESTYIRPWATLQDAEQWLTFINALEVPPVSTAILPD